MTSRSRIALPVVLGLAAALALSACSDGGTDRKLQSAVSRFAHAIPVGDVSGTAFTTPDAATLLADLWKPLKSYDSEAAVGTITEKDGTATATLNWTTNLPGGTWKHTTTVALRRSGSDWKVVWKPSILESSLVDGEQLVVTGLKAQRGNILGGNDQPLVTLRPVVRFGIDKAVAAEKNPGADLGASARRLAQLLGLTPEPWVKAVAKAGPRAFVEFVTLREADVTQQLLGGVATIPGARSIADQRPLAPTKDFAAALLGTVGPATAELIKKSDGALRVGDDTGLSGLQLRYNEQLAGTAGIKVSAQEPAANRTTGEPRVLFIRPAVAGTDLKLTLNQRLQAKAQDLLKRYGPASALVAVRPSTGQILAAASGPGSNGYNTATFGQYAPGSTFKVVSSLALLRAGLKPSTVVSCPQTTVVDGKKFKNYSDYPSNRFGRITLEQAVANSCNTAFVTSRDKIKGTALADAAAALGFGVDHDMGFPAYFGQVPAPASETEAAADLIGQGKILASPYAMAAVVASVVHGATVVPDLVRGDDPVTADPAEPLTKAEAASLRELMGAVVRDGSGAFLQALGSPAVIAKTGTAEYGTSKGGALPTHAWMIGAQGDLAVAVFVDTGASGSRTAGPVLEAFLRAAR